MVEADKMKKALKRLVGKEPYTVKQIAEECDVSIQAVHKWPLTGKISDVNLEALCRLYKVDFWAMRTKGEIIPAGANVPEPDDPNDPDIAYLIYQKSRSLNETLQLTILNLIESISATVAEARRKKSSAKTPV